MSAAAPAAHDASRWPPPALVDAKAPAEAHHPWHEPGAALAVPADRRVRPALELPHRSPGRSGRLRRLVVHPTLRLTERLRQPPRPRGGTLPVRAVRDQRAHGTALRPGHQRRGDDLEDAIGLARRARRPDDDSMDRT